MKRTHILSLFCLLWFVGVFRSAPVPVVQSEPNIPTIGPNDLGMSFINSAEDLRSDARIQRGIATGAKMDRYPMYWHNVETSPGHFDWSRMDAAIGNNERHGLGTLPILLGTAPFYFPTAARAMDIVKMPRVGGGPLRSEIASELEATSEGAEKLANGCTVAGTPPARNLFAPIFTDGTDVPAQGKAINPANHWAYFVSKAVDRYRPGGFAGLNVRYWEVWNEPDLCHFWGGTVHEYARLLKVSYLVIKYFDPQATVVWGGLAIYGPKYEGGRNFLGELVAELKGDPMAAAHNGFFDAAAIHQYSNVVHGYNYTRRVRGALAGTGWENKPIWVTESGVPVCGSYPGPACPSPYRATEQEQAAYIWQNIFYTRLGDNRGPIFHFMLHDDGGNECRPTPPADAFGLVTNEPDARCVPHTAQPRLSYRAYQLAAQYLAGTELLWADIQDYVARRVVFYDPASGERRMLVWAIDAQDVVVELPAMGSSARRISLDGSETTIYPENGVYRIWVPRATNQSQPNSNTYTIGGTPYLLIEHDNLPPTGYIEELLPVSPPTFEVAWHLSDTGSGVESVNLYFQRDNEPWQLWLSNQGASGSAYFNGEEGRRYRFFAQGRDRAGNVDQSFTPMAETIVSNEPQYVRVSGVVLDMKGQPSPWTPVSVGPFGTIADNQGHFSVTALVGRWDVSVGGEISRHRQLLMDDSVWTLVAPPVVNPVANGDFEGALDNWSVGGSSTISIGQWGGSRDNLARLASTFIPSPGVPGTDGWGGNSTLSQRIQVPAGHPYLSFAYRFESLETDGGNGSCTNPALLHDKFEVIVARDGVPADYIHCQEQASDWSIRFLDLSAYAGQSVTLIFNVYESSAQNRSSALLDGIMVGESPVRGEPRRLFLPIAGR